MAKRDYFSGSMKLMVEALFDFDPFCRYLFLALNDLFFVCVDNILNFECWDGYMSNQVHLFFKEVFNL